MVSFLWLLFNNFSLCFSLTIMSEVVIFVFPISAVCKDSWISGLMSLDSFGRFLASLTSSIASAPICLSSHHFSSLLHIRSFYHVSHCSYALISIFIFFFHFMLHLVSSSWFKAQISCIQIFNYSKSLSEFFSGPLHIFYCSCWNFEHILGFDELGFVNFH